MMPLVQEVSLLVIIFGYALIMACLIPLGFCVILKDIRSRRKFSDDIVGKLNNEISIDVDLIRHISKTRGLKEGAATAVLRELLANSRNKERDQVFLKLCNDMDEIEPYADLPSEVRLSLIRLKEITKSNERYLPDELLQPIISNLSAHVDLKSEYLKSKKITFAANLISIISFLFGIWGVVISLSSPNLDQIKNVFDTSVENIAKDHTVIK